MNKERRKALGELIDSLSSLDLDSVKSKLEDIKDAIEALKDEEQECFDNLPQSLQDGEKGEGFQYAVDQLDEAINELGSLIDSFDSFDRDAVIENIDNARGE